MWIFYYQGFFFHRLHNERGLQTELGLQCLPLNVELTLIDALPCNFVIDQPCKRSTSHDLGLSINTECHKRIHRKEGENREGKKKEHDVITASRQQFKGHWLCADLHSFLIDVCQTAPTVSGKQNISSFSPLNKLWLKEFVPWCVLCVYRVWELCADLNSLTTYKYQTWLPE